MLRRLAGAAAALFAAGPVWAQAFPARPVRIVVPFAAGGGTDIIARVLAQKLSDAWGQQAVVDNRAGGGSMIGSELVARASPDGHTLLLTANPHTQNPALHERMPYDTLKDFAAVTLLAQAPLAVVVHPSLPVRGVPELIALARSRPGQLNYGSSGNAGPQHFAGELFRSMAGIEMAHIPYKGSAPATTELIAGQVQVGFGSMLTVMPHVKGGRLRALAVTSARRSAAAPELPTVAEAALPGYESTTWYGVLATGGTPSATLQRLHADIVRTLALPDVRERLAKDGSEAVGSAPDRFSAFIVAEIERARGVAQKARMRAD